METPKCLQDVIPAHIQEIKRLVHEEGLTLEADIFNHKYRLSRAIIGFEHAYELVEFKTEPPPIVTILLDMNLELAPVSVGNPDNTFTPEDVHMIVEIMLNRHMQSG